MKIYCTSVFLEQKLFSDDHTRHISVLLECGYPLTQVGSLHGWSSPPPEQTIIHPGNWQMSLVFRVPGIFSSRGPGSTDQTIECLSNNSCAVGILYSGWFTFSTLQRLPESICATTYRVKLSNTVTDVQIPHEGHLSLTVV
jgi:hypothetical protein